MIPIFFHQIWTSFGKKQLFHVTFQKNVHFVLFLKIQSLFPYPLLTKSIRKWKFPSSTNLDGFMLLPHPITKCHDSDLCISNPASFLGIPNLNFVPDMSHSVLCFRFSSPTSRKMLSSALHTPRLVPYTFQAISYSNLDL